MALRYLVYVFVIITFRECLYFANFDLDGLDLKTLSVTKRKKKVATVKLTLNLNY